MGHSERLTCKVNDSSNTGQVLKKNSRRPKWNFHLVELLYLPVENLFNIGLIDVEPIAGTDSRFKKNSNREWQLLYK